MEIPDYKGFGREIVVQFTCARCKKIVYTPLEKCTTSDYAVRYLSDLKAPKGWRDGGYYYPTFCPECAEKYDRFMKGAEDGK